MSRATVSSLHEGDFGLPFVTFPVGRMYYVYKESHMAGFDKIGWDYGGFLQRTLEGRLGEMCGENLDLH